MNLPPLRKAGKNVAQRLSSTGVFTAAGGSHLAVDQMKDSGFRLALYRGCCCDRSYRSNENR